MAEHDAVVERLAPCPFCGGKADPEGWKSAGGTGPECEDCGATAASDVDWNHRLAPPAIKVGNPLPNGLWAAPEEMTPKMVKAALKEYGLLDMYKAMRRAAGGGDG